MTLENKIDTTIEFPIRERYIYMNHAGVAPFRPAPKQQSASLLAPRRKKARSITQHGYTPWVLPVRHQGS